jgi:hypothetical protein
MQCLPKRTPRGTNLGINTALFIGSVHCFNAVQEWLNKETSLFDPTSHDSGVMDACSAQVSQHNTYFIHRLPHTSSFGDVFQPAVAYR